MNRSNLKKALRLFVLTTILCGASFAVSDDGTLYLAGKVYTVDGESISPGQVLVVDGKIKSVGSELDMSGKDPTVVDLGEGSVLMPGLVDPYSQTGLGDDGSDEITAEITPRFRAIDSVDWDKAALRRQSEKGTTTMCVCPGTQNVFPGIAAIVKTAEHGDGYVLNDDGPLLASMCSDPASQNRARSRPDSIFVRQPTNRMGVVWILRKTFDKAKRSEEPKNLDPIRQVLNEKRHMMVVSRMAHDLNTVATLADEFGFSPILVGGQEAYKMKETIAERKYPVILQKIGTESVRGPEGAEVSWNQAGLLAEAGITIALSGDDLLEQARFAHRNGLDASQAIAAITSTPARLLHVDDRVGSIVVGKDADMIAFNGEPLELSSSIRWVLINGKIIETQKGN